MIAGGGEPSAEALLHALSGVGERLVMLDRRVMRGAGWPAATKLSAALRLPLLFDQDRRDRIRYLKRRSAMA